jgi:hypothetical protein
MGVWKVIRYSSDKCVVKKKTGHATRGTVWFAMRSGSMSECREFLRLRGVEPNGVPVVAGRSKHAAKTA